MKYEIFLWLLLIAGGFFAGSIMFCRLIPQLLLHRDVCAEHADRNPGAANVFSSCGVAMGMLCLVLDLAKGLLPVCAALKLLSPHSLWFAWVMAAPVLGHAIAPLNHFHGGKCIAASFGVLLALVPVSPVYLAILAVVYILFSTILRISPNDRRSIAAFGVFGLLSVVFSLYSRHFSVAIGCCAIAVTAIVRHLPAQLGAAEERPSLFSFKKR